MSKRLLTIILIISLAFNVAVLVMAGIRFGTSPERHRKEAIKSFKKMKETRPEIHKRFKQAIRQIDRRNSSLRFDFITELIKENPDYEYLESAVDSLKIYNAELIMNIHHEMIELRKNINHNEAKEIFGFHQRRMEDERRRKREHHRPRPRHMDEFHHPPK
jgi:hypothetical protein